MYAGTVLACRYDHDVVFETAGGCSDYGASSNAAEQQIGFAQWSTLLQTCAFVLLMLRPMPPRDESAGWKCVRWQELR